jgi:dethiobiotin synthetase
MTPRIVVAGTDTGIGKTVFSAALVAALDGIYWKPVQAGLDEHTDRATVQHLSGLGADRLLPEAYRLNTPASPHLAAEIDGVAIDPARLVLPHAERPLVVEGAGGLMVPLTRDITYLDIMAEWRVPVVLCARTALGTIITACCRSPLCVRATCPCSGSPSSVTPWWIPKRPSPKWGK